MEYGRWNIEYGDGGRSYFLVAAGVTLAGAAT